MDIFYRGWDKEKREMVYGIHGHSQHHSDKNSNAFDSYSDWSFADFIDAEAYGDFDIMRYIGWRDINDRKIYFDDIVKVRFTDKEDAKQNFITEALVTEGMSGNATLLIDGIHEEFWDDNEVWSIDVIGNIKESPERANELGL